MEKQQIVNAINEAATFIEACPQRYDFWSIDVPLPRYSDAAKACVLGWIGYYLRAHVAVEHISGVAELLGYKQRFMQRDGELLWEGDSGAFYDALDSFTELVDAAEHSAAGYQPRLWHIADVKETVFVLRGFARWFAAQQGEGEV